MNTFLKNQYVNEIHNMSVIPENISKVKKKMTLRCALNINSYQDGRILRICPKCKLLKDIDDFGFRLMNDKVTNQSWCSKCRADASQLNKDIKCTQSTRYTSRNELC